MGLWFGRKSAPADVRPFVPQWLRSEATEVGFARSYSEQFDEVYRRNPVGQRAVRLVSGMTANLLLHGNAYVQLIADGNDRPAELCLLRPERVSVISDERGWPVAYLYRAGAQVELLSGRADRRAIVVRVEKR
jgi:phage portal protein BeeE